MKQLGGHPNKRENMESFPLELRIREFPTMTVVPNERQSFCHERLGDAALAIRYLRKRLGIDIPSAVFRIDQIEKGSGVYSNVPD
jgi:hypothetical protein